MAGGVVITAASQRRARSCSPMTLQPRPAAVSDAFLDSGRGDAKPASRDAGYSAYCFCMQDGSPPGSYDSDSYQFNT